MARGKSNIGDAIPIRFEDETMEQIAAVVERTHLNRSFVIQAAVRLALKRYAKGDRSWLLNEDNSEAETALLAEKGTGYTAPKPQQPPPPPSTTARNAIAAASARTSFYVVTRKG